MRQTVTENGKGSAALFSVMPFQSWPHFTNHCKCFYPDLSEPRQHCQMSSWTCMEVKILWTKVCRHGEPTNRGRFQESKTRRRRKSICLGGPQIHSSSAHIWTCDWHPNMTEGDPKVLPRFHLYTDYWSIGPCQPWSVFPFRIHCPHSSGGFTFPVTSRWCQWCPKSTVLP